MGFIQFFNIYYKNYNFECNRKYLQYKYVFCMLFDRNKGWLTKISNNFIIRTIEKNDNYLFEL